MQPKGTNLCGFYVCENILKQVTERAQDFMEVREQYIHNSLFITIHCVQCIRNICYDDWYSYWSPSSYIVGSITKQARTGGALCTNSRWIGGIYTWGNHKPRWKVPLAGPRWIMLKNRHVIEKTGTSPGCDHLHVTKLYRLYSSGCDLHVSKKLLYMHQYNVYYICVVVYINIIRKLVWNVHKIR